jgi:spoIIIJ-associated protein
MRALQFLVSNALRSKDFAHNRVNVDIADYKKARAEQLAERATEWIKKVQETGEEMQLNPMNAADRRIVHKVASEAGLQTESVGEGRDRHIVLKLAN